MGAWLPSWSLALLFALFAICRFENQRWTRARAHGRRGASEGFGAFVDLTGLAAFVFGIVFLVAVGFDNGWQASVGLFLFGLLASIAYTLVSTRIVGGDSLVLWMLGTLGVWVIAVVLAFRTTWFGLFD